MTPTKDQALQDAKQALVAYFRILGDEKNGIPIPKEMRIALQEKLKRCPPGQYASGGFRFVPEHPQRADRVIAHLLEGNRAAEGHGKRTSEFYTDLIDAAEQRPASRWDMDFVQHMTVMLEAFESEALLQVGRLKEVRDKMEAHLSRTVPGMVEIALKSFDRTAARKDSSEHIKRASQLILDALDETKLLEKFNALSQITKHQSSASRAT